MLSQEVGPAKAWPESRHVHCDRCGRQVDQFTVEWGIRDVPDDMSFYLRKEHSGEVIVTIQCHGERWKMSNWRGRLPD